MTSSYPELPVATGSTAATTIPATQIISRVFDNATTAPFAFFMSVWTTLFLEFWKRRNYILQWEWDVLEFEKEEQPRPEYYGTTVRISPVTMRDELYYPSSLKLTKAVVSGMLVGASILIVLCTVGTLIVFTAWTRSVHALSGYWSAVVSAMVNLATIMLLNRVYARFAVILTNFENHRTQTMYEGSLIVKHYLFSFINFYSTLFYILIFKQQFGRNLLGQSELDDQCQYGSCMTELTIQLAITFVGRQAIAQGQEVFIPWITKLYYKKRDSLARHQGEYAHHDVTQQHGLPASNPLVSPHPTMVPQWVEDGHLPVYDDSIFTEYNEMVVQFGFVSLFVAAFPLAPLLALLNNVIEVRSDAYKLLTAYQRPVAYQAQDIGMWEKILNILSIISVLTNGAIIAFQSAYMERVLINRFGQENLLASRLGFLIVFEHAVLLLKFLLAYLIPDMPTFVKVAIERESYTARKKLSPADDPSDSDTDTDSSPHSPIPGSGDERIEMDMERGRARSDALARDSALAATAMSEGVPMGRREAPEGKPEKRRRSGKRKARGE
ncbi:hypothetical protein BC936DRAFT_146189 [Jimgerdemannia flammicorona]|uniref:Anoctamin transmembrane domain-containing protein n=1 Tax=Jimgerdemannia flammicorona TaxID=994334 RepID=A0A433D865_9FUNG|nr:hypothetical protein BC936DRAFT_146189 [Jimgerdemannia flammicorona]